MVVQQVKITRTPTIHFINKITITAKGFRDGLDSLVFRHVSVAASSGYSGTAEICLPVCFETGAIPMT